ALFARTWHLPRKGGDRMSLPLSPIADVAGWAMRLKLPISPLEGEMSGRTEGGVQAPTYALKTSEYPETPSDR
ncbi:MAG: hypothetical protein E5X55_38325, partial [Mesorhizobium sp.]